MVWHDGAPFIVWKGLNSIDFGCIVTKLPRIQVAEDRMEAVTIPGRDGVLHISDGCADSYKTECEITILDDARRSEIFAWLRGSSNLITSDDPDHLIKAMVVSKIDPEYIIPGMKTIIVEFDCQPYRYEASPTIVSLTASGAINNHGTADAYPIITVTGTGTLTIDSDAYVFTESGVTVNSEIQECYAGAVSKNSTVSGGFPVLTPGVHTVTLGTGITAVSIQINARWY